MSIQYAMMLDEVGHTSVTLVNTKATPQVPFTDISDPGLAGYQVVFESSDPSVVGVEVQPNGLSASLTSDGVGTATITVSTFKPDGTHVQDSPDTIVVTVKNPAPNKQNLTVSAPTPELEPEP